MSESDRRYPDYGPEVNAILDVARAARMLKKAFPETCVGNVTQFLDEPAQNWALSLVDIIMDYEEATEAGDVAQQ